MATPISRDELVSLLASGTPIALVEALGADFYADAHLPGAVNVPVAQAPTLAPVLLPDRDVTVVVYCSGSCDESVQLAAALESLAYRDVRVYAAGKEDWIEAGLPVERDT